MFYTFPMGSGDDMKISLIKKRIMKLMKERIWQLKPRSMQNLK